MAWAYSVLTASAPLADALDVTLAELPTRVWPDVAPPDTQGPWVVYNVTQPVDVLGVGSVPRLMSGVALTAQVVDQVRSYDALTDAARVLYDVLHGALNQPVPGGGVVLTARRTNGVQYPEHTAGIEYRHLGHTLQVEVQ